MVTVTAIGTHTTASSSVPNAVITTGNALSGTLIFGVVCTGTAVGISVTDTNSNVYTIGTAASSLLQTLTPFWAVASGDLLTGAIITVTFSSGGGATVVLVTAISGLSAHTGVFQGPGYTGFGSNPSANVSPTVGNGVALGILGFTNTSYSESSNYTSVQQTSTGLGVDIALAYDLVPGTLVPTYAPVIGSQPFATNALYFTVGGLYRQTVSAALLGLTHAPKTLSKAVQPTSAQSVKLILQYGKVFSTALVEVVFVFLARLKIFSIATVGIVNAAEIRERFISVTVNSAQGLQGLIKNIHKFVGVASSEVALGAKTLVKVTSTSIAEIVHTSRASIVFIGAALAQKVLAKTSPAVIVKALSAEVASLVRVAPKQVSLTTSQYVMEVKALLSHVSVGQALKTTVVNLVVKTLGTFLAESASIRKAPQVVRGFGEGQFISVSRMASLIRGVSSSEIVLVVKSKLALISTSLAPVASLLKRTIRYVPLGTSLAQVPSVRQNAAKAILTLLAESVLALKGVQLKVASTFLFGQANVARGEKKIVHSTSPQAIHAFASFVRLVNVAMFSLYKAVKGPMKTLSLASPQRLSVVRSTTKTLGTALAESVSRVILLARAISTVLVSRTSVSFLSGKNHILTLSAASVQAVSVLRNYLKRRRQILSIFYKSSEDK